MDRTAAAIVLLTMVMSAGIVASLAASLRRARKNVAELLAAGTRRGGSESIDIGQLTRAVEEARELKERLEMAVRGSQVAIFDFELQGNAIGESNLDGYNIWESRGHDSWIRAPDYASGIELLVAPEDRERVTGAVDACIRGETPGLEVEYRSLGYADDLVHWRLARGNVLRDAHGTPVRFLGTSLDITSLKRAEEGRRGATKLLELATNLTNVRVWIFDICDGRLADARGTFINWESPGQERKIPAADFATGIERTAVPEDRNRLIAVAEACVRGEIPEVRVEYRAIGPGDGGGTFHWQLAHGTVQRDTNGAPIRFLGTSIDINRLKRAEEEKRRATELLELATRFSNVYIWAFDMNGGQIADALATLINVQESLGHNIPTGPFDTGFTMALVVLPDDRGTVMRAVTACLSGETPQFQAEYRVRHIDGSIRWNLGRGTVTHDAAGVPLRFLGTSVDITDRKRVEEQLRESERRWRNLAETLPQLVWTASPDGRIDYLSAQATAYAGLSESELVGDGWTNIIHPDDKGNIGQSWDVAIKTQQPYEVQHRLRRSDGEYRWFTTRAEAARDSTGHVIKWVGTSTDITSLKVIEAELQRARDAAETANRAKDEFLANVSHEIRTPMNAILGMTELALESAATDDLKRMLSTVRSAARNLLGIINELLDFSKIEAGKLALEQAEFSLRGELGDTLRALAPRACRKGLELVCRVHPDIPDALFGDAGRLRQVLTNLLGNALKFTEQGEVGVEVISATAAPPSEGKVGLIFRVRDTGIGIARDKQAAIFRAFEQGDSSTTRKYGGTGLGLTISAQLAVLMDGAITVESEPGRGSTFDFTAHFGRSSKRETGNLLPSQHESSLDVARPVALVLEPRLRALRFLVAEDNELNVALLTELLKNRGHSAQFAGDGRAALALASVGDFDLMLLDLHMPEMDGFEVLSAVRERERITSRHLPIVALTARASTRDRERCLAAGMDDFVSKPIEAEALWLAVARVVAPFPSAERRGPRLLDPGAIRRACGGQAAVFDRLCEVFQRSLPDQVMRIHAARRDRDLSSLRGMAHKLYGTLGAFSTVAGELALTLEDSATRGEMERCEQLVDQLESVCAELLEDTRTLTLNDLSS